MAWGLRRLEEQGHSGTGGPRGPRTREDGQSL